MQLDDLLLRYFATTDLSGVAPDTFTAGIEHCRVDLGLEEDRNAARNFMDLLAASEGDGVS